MVQIIEETSTATVTREAKGKQKIGETVKKTRVLLLSTHPEQVNGYSQVTYHILRHLGKKTDLELVNYGFQRFNQIEGENRMEKIPSNVIVYDAAKAEVPAQQGFGIAQFRDFFRLAKPDVVVIFNDASVVSSFLIELKRDPLICPPETKIITYLDQVYPHQRTDFLNVIQQCSDYIITFTDYWRAELLKQGITKPISSVFHGFDQEKFFPTPITKPDPTRMVVLNMNRNQPRKRLDITVIALARVFAKRPDANIHFILGCDIQNGSWNLAEIYHTELMKHFNPEDAKKYMDRLLTLQNAARLTDKQVNQLYNETDVGLNTCSGEGCGLSQLQHAGVGKPQIASAVGGLLAFLDDAWSTLVKPKLSLYADQNNEVQGGEIQIVDAEDVADAILRYYDDPELRKEHGKRAREYIMRNCRWADEMEKFYAIIKEVASA